MWSTLLVILLGILSSTQNHLAKALERQGIEIFDLLKARLKGTTEAIEGGAKRPVIYVIGLILNHTTFLYHLLVSPLGGTTALYTSMYGMGLIALLVYSNRVMKEKLTRLELWGALVILLGTLTIGIEGIYRPPLDMGTIPLPSILVALAIISGMGLLLIIVGLRAGSHKVLGLSFGLCAGLVGTLDPFLKGVGQASGEGGRFVPGSIGGWILLGASFLIGELAVVITQWGYIRRARANILVPAYNGGYIILPVLLQAILLPGYAFYWSTGIGLALILGGIVLIRALREEED